MLACCKWKIGGLKYYGSSPNSLCFSHKPQDCIPEKYHSWPDGITKIKMTEEEWILEKWGKVSYKLEKAMAPHSSTLAWKMPWAEEPGRLQSMGSWRVRHDWPISPSLFSFMHWRRKWQPTPVFLPGESQGCGSLVGCHLWGRTELDTTEVT